MGNVKIINAVLCEDIRHEINNKNSLIGVFSGDVLISELPGKVRFAIYYEASVEMPGKIKSEIRLQYADKAAFTAELEHDVQTKYISSATPPFELVIENEGDFVVSVRFEEQDWKEIIRRRISLDARIATSAST